MIRAYLVVTSAPLFVFACSVPRHQAPAQGSQTAPSGRVEVSLDAMERVLAEEDCDGDRRITVLDRDESRRKVSTCDGNATFDLTTNSGRKIRVSGTAFISNLLGELELARRSGKTAVDLSHVFEDPVTRVSRQIRERFWDSLTRRIDAEHIDNVLDDPKVRGKRLLYVAADDPPAFEYFSAVALRGKEPAFEVRQLPRNPSPAWVKGLGDAHGLLALSLEGEAPHVQGTPYVVPGGRFNELYGWDSYFHVLGLVADGRYELAQNIVKNLVYEIVHYGKILNANRTYYLTRSQPPFLTSMLRALLEAPHRDQAIERSFVETTLRAAIREYETVWSGEKRRTTLCESRNVGIVCLARYFGEGIGEPPEVEPDHFRWIYQKYAARRGVTIDVYRDGYRSGAIKEPALDRFFTHDRAMRESGHDTTYRWFDDRLGEDRTSDYATIDLNALLYKYETDIASILAHEFSGRLDGPSGTETSNAWCERAAARAVLIRRHLYDGGQGLFFDYDVRSNHQSTYLSATTFYPLWVSTSVCSAPLVSTDEASRLVKAGLDRLEGPGGVFATAEASVKAFPRSKPRQWDHPNGWAPHQILTWAGLDKFGLATERERLAYKWLYTIVKNASDYAGTIPEKFDVEQRTHRVYAEYGNVGTDFAYITDEGFGWMNASFQIGLQTMSPASVDALKRLETPEQRFAPASGAAR